MQETRDNELEYNQSESEICHFVQLSNASAPFHLSALSCFNVLFLV